MRTVQDIMAENGSLANIERFQTMQKWEHKRKVEHAQEMAEAFFCWARENGKSVHLSVGGLDSITLHYFLLQLALDLDVPIPAEYGEIARDPDGRLYTTKAQRTGCTMCGFGIHIEGRPHRFDALRQQNPKEWDFWMKHVCRDENGDWYGWGRVLDYIGVGWEDVPEQAVQMTVDDFAGGTSCT